MPQESDHDFNWLYGEKRRPPSPAKPGPNDQATAGHRAMGDPEPTQQIRTSPRRPSAPSEARPASGAAAVSDDQIAPEPGRGAPPRGPRAPKPTKDSRPPRRRGRLRWMWALLAAWLVFLVAVPIWAYGRIERFDGEPAGARPDEQPGTTYLLVGSDSREGLTREQRRKLGTGNAAGRRTDTIMMLHTGSGRSTLISIPRDSLVPIPGHGTTKINAAYAYGGPRLLTRTVEQNTGVRIDHFVEIGFGGFVKAVDAVGGIRICTKTRLDDPMANLHMAKGCHQADGATALAYARSRHTQADGDLGRARHQREVVSKVGAKVKSPWTVLNPVRYVGLADAGSTSLRISQGTGPIALATFALAMTGARSCAMPIRDMAVHWDSTRAKRLMNLIASDSTDSISKDLCTPNGLPN